MITGGTGFLGSYVARYLVKEQGLGDVVIFDRSPDPDRIADIQDQVTVVQGDVQEPLEVLGAMQQHNVEQVVHMAFIAGVEEPGRALPYLRFQTTATATVFDCARLQGIKRVVNASSHAVYTASDDGIALTEDEPLRPSGGLYGACKVWTEHVADNYNGRYEMEIISLRLQSAYGIGRVNRAKTWTGGLLNTSGWKQPNYRANAELAVMGRPVTMPPDEQIDDFLHAHDTAQACWLAATAQMPEHCVFNVSNEHRPIGDYTRILKDLLPSAKVTTSDKVRTSRTLLDNTRIRDELGFAPKYTLEKGLRAYIEEVSCRIKNT
ncbi:MAG: NAD(P)-dependent oxidoreductase [Novosphingobium sp.]|nr:NAD(P)-dependent oxidoreductase [Novosphingobium sp.]